MATRTPKAPAKAPAPQDTGASQDTGADAPDEVDLLALAQSEEIGKSARVYVGAFDAIDPAPMSDGRLAEVQRELRADGSRGPLMLAVIRKPRVKGQDPSVQRYPVADYADARDALAKVGIRL